MLMIVAYDIADPKRLAQIARHCEDYGVRVQFSIFECHLEANLFEQFWSDLMALIDPKADRIVAYRICAQCAQEVREGGIMSPLGGEKVIAYVF